MDTRPPTAAHHPQVRVSLPEDGRLDARIQWWHEDTAGARWAVVAYKGWVNGQEYDFLMRVPAANITLVRGQDYSRVEHKPAT